jgi:hypothetical protein
MTYFWTKSGRDLFKHSGNDSGTLFEQRLVAKGLKAFELVGKELMLNDFQ